MKGRRSIDFLQNITIAVLSVSAVFLFSQTELFRLGWETGSGYFQLFPEGGGTVRAGAESGVLSAPVRICVTAGYGRYGSVAATTAGEEFRPLRRLLSDALADTGETEECREEDFLAALEETGVYCDFLRPLPLSLLAGLTDGSSGSEEAVRRVLLAREGDGVTLYLTDGERYLRRAAPVSLAELEEAASRYETGGAVFAMERDVSGRLAPLSLLPEQTPSLPVLSAQSGVTDTDRLLATLGFNPLTNSRYTEANGTEVIVESGRSLRIRSGGGIYYQSGGRADLTVECAGETPTAWEAARDCAALLEAILPESGLWVQEVQGGGERTVLRFGYQVDGVPVLFAGGGCAAEAVLEGRTVASLELRPRRYAASEESSRLLPLPQALGIAELSPGAELSLAYADAGGIQAKAEWITS